MKIQERSLWLHASHGEAGDNLSPIEVPRLREGESRAASLVNSSHPATFSPGLPCQLRGSQLWVGTEDSEFYVSSLFLADVSAERLPDPKAESEHNYLISIIPHDNEAAGDCLTRIAMDTSLEAWLLFCQGATSWWHAIAEFAHVGVLLRDFDKVFCTELEEENLIGRGANASVHKLPFGHDGGFAAVKCMKPEVSVTAISRELHALRDVQLHENIIGMLCTFLRHDLESISFAVAYPLVCGGDLLERVIRGGPIHEDKAKIVFRGVLQGLARIHSRNIVHRDIKPENILLSGGSQAIITDFGLATHVDNEPEMRRRCGSIGYVAPEVCLGNPYGPKVDIFAAGVVLYFMLSRELPFSPLDGSASVEDRMKSTVKCKLFLRRHPFGGLSRSIRNMLKATICKISENRLSAEEALLGEWLLSGSIGIRSSGSCENSDLATSSSPQKKNYSSEDKDNNNEEDE